MAETSADRRGARPLHLPARHPDRAVLRRRRACSTARTASPPTSRSPPAARRACCSARARRGRLVLLRQGRPAALRPQLRRAGQLYQVAVARRPCRRAGTSCASSSSRPAQPDIANGQGRAGARPALRRRQAGRRESDMPVTTPLTFNPGGLTCGADPGLTGDPRLPGPVPLHRHAPHRDRRRQRRTHQRQRERDAPGHGAPVARCPTPAAHRPATGGR